MISLWLKDPKSKEPSVTLTLLVSGFLVATAKLLVSGITLQTITLSQFTGGDFATVVGSLGALYWGRRNASMGGAQE